MTTPAPLSGSPRWVEPEDTPEQIADACVAHLAAGGRVDRWLDAVSAWHPSHLAGGANFANHSRSGVRFALVYSDPPQPERPSEVGAIGFDRVSPNAPAIAARDRVSAPEGVTVIGCMPDGRLLVENLAPAVADWQRDVVHLYALTPHSPPVPETERDLTPEELAAAVDAAPRVRANPGHGVLLPPSATYPNGLLVEWLPLDGTDGEDQS